MKVKLKESHPNIAKHKLFDFAFGALAGLMSSLRFFKLLTILKFYISNISFKYSKKKGLSIKFGIQER